MYVIRKVPDSSCTYQRILNLYLLTQRKTGRLIKELTTFYIQTKAVSSMFRNNLEEWSIIQAGFLISNPITHSKEFSFFNIFPIIIILRDGNEWIRLTRNYNLSIEFSYSAFPSSKWGGGGVLNLIKKVALISSSLLLKVNIIDYQAVTKFWNK